jgi:flagella basal body P-ring formation protein FlgA
LRPSVSLDASIITVGDIVEIIESDPYLKRQIAQVEIGPSPEADTPRWIDLTEIKESIAREGVRLDNVTFAGSRRVEVRRQSPPTEQVVTRKSREHWRGEIERLVRETLEQESHRQPNAEPFPGSGAAEGIRIHVEGDRLLDFLTEQPNEPWQLILPQQWQVGWQQARVDVQTAGQTAKYSLMIHIQPARQVVVPRIPVARGSVITAGDVMLVAYEKSTTDRELLMDLQQAVGQEAKRDLRAGEPILARDIRKTPIVFRGQPVTVHIRYGTAWLQKTFLASSDAGIGEWIEVYDSQGSTNQTHPYQVRVFGPHQAELPPDAPPSRAINRTTKSTSTARKPPANLAGRRAN